MISLNQQPVEKVDRPADGSLDVYKFWYTIQGEGPFAGRPAVFLRLAGCNLQCPFCDTDYTSHRGRMPVQSIIQSIRGQLAIAGRPQKNALLVITGGEPLRQGLGSLIRLFQKQIGGDVQIETNGTVYDPSLVGETERVVGEDPVFVVCSPKTPKLAEDLLPFIRAYKYVLSSSAVDPRDGLPTSALGMSAPPARPHPGFDGEVFVQPMDSGVVEVDRENLRAASESCLRFGYRLSIQIHKLAGLE